MAARVLGWLALITAATAAAPFVVESQGVGKEFIICSLLAVVAALFGGIGIAVNRHAAHPRSWLPAIGLVAGILLIVLYAVTIHGLAGLAGMRS